MSTVKFKKDHDLGKKGDTKSVPYIVGKQLLADGVAEYPVTADSKAAGRKAATQEAVQAELEAAKQRVAELEAQNKKLNSELNEVLAADPKPKADAKTPETKTPEPFHKAPGAKDR